MSRQVRVCPDVQSLNINRSSHTLFPTACTSRHCNRVVVSIARTAREISHTRTLKAPATSLSLLSTELPVQSALSIAVPRKCGVHGADHKFTLKNLFVPTSSGTCLSGKTAIDFPALCGLLWILLEFEFISLDGVRNPVEGLVSAGVEPVFAFHLDNQVDEELRIGSVISEHYMENFACTDLASTNW